MPTGSASASASARARARASFRAAYDTALGQWPGRVEAVELPTPYGLTRVNSCGPLSAPPLVLLPGGGATSAVWGACAAAGLARGHRVHAVDLVGDPGLSVPAPGRPVRTTGDLVGWLDAVLDALLGEAGGPGRQALTLGGHSYGAWIAAHYAAHYAARNAVPGATHSAARSGSQPAARSGSQPASRDGARLGRLVLLDPTQVFTGLRPGYVLRALPMLVRPTPRRIRSFLAWETGGAALDPAWLRLQDETARFPAVRPVTGPRPDLAGVSGPGELPVHVLFAERARCHDAARAARAAAAALPGARIDVLSGVSHHGLPLTAAEEIARRLVQG
ncbi:alpha/beta fold hydrolase [Streptomyces sp. NPDC088762]|uniref:alpha/beta fold hydrolase n=1 Tax=Streptomyces sp. NPDC088762 TaxID=3365891 RepID=UPI00382C751A